MEGLWMCQTRRQRCWPRSTSSRLVSRVVQRSTRVGPWGDVRWIAAWILIVGCSGPEKPDDGVNTEEGTHEETENYPSPDSGEPDEITCGWMGEPPGCQGSIPVTEWNYASSPTANAVSQCEDGRLHRDVEPRCDLGGDTECGSCDESCGAGELCIDIGSEEPDCVCHAVPVTPADCGPGMTVWCAGLHSFCVPSDCSFDGDCPSGSLCLVSLISGPCGDIVGMHCEDSHDECRVDGDCVCEGKGDVCSAEGCTFAPEPADCD